MSKVVAGGIYANKEKLKLKVCLPRRSKQHKTRPRDPYASSLPALPPRFSRPRTGSVPSPPPFSRPWPRTDDPVLSVVNDPSSPTRHYSPGPRVYSSLVPGHTRFPRGGAVRHLNHDRRGPKGLVDHSTVVDESDLVVSVLSARRPGFPSPWGVPSTPVRPQPAAPPFPPTSPSVVSERRGGPPVATRWTRSCLGWQSHPPSLRPREDPGAETNSPPERPGVRHFYRRGSGHVKGPTSCVGARNSAGVSVGVRLDQGGESERVRGSGAGRRVWTS